MPAAFPVLPPVWRAALLAAAVSCHAGHADPVDEGGTGEGWGAPTRVSTLDAVARHLEPSTITFRETSVNLPGSHLREDTAAYSVEAVIAPPFTVFRAAFGGLLPGAVLLNVIPKFVVRRSDGVVSNPVRTPGYLPTAALYYSPRDTVTAAPRGAGPGLPDFWYLSFTIQHYSNGQTGPLLRPDGGGPNNVDGSFSLWSTAAAVHFHNDWPLLPEYKALQVEYLFNKEGALDALYPDHVVSLALHTGDYRHGSERGFAGRSRILMDLAWRGRKRNGMPDEWKPEPFSAALTAVYAPRWAPSRARTPPGAAPALRLDFALFARFYAGFDYYNMNFDQEIRRVDLGLMFGPQGWTGTP